MIPIAGEIVDWDALFKVVYQSLGAGLGVAFAFSIAVAGSTRFADEVRDNRRSRAAVYGVVAALGLAACIGAVVFGIVVMTAKD